MKVSQLFETKMASPSDKELIAVARQAGEKMFGTSHTGLVFRNKVTHMSYADYLHRQENEDEGEDKAVVGTYEYVFYPSNGKGEDASDDVLTKKHVDKDGNIYIGGADGVFVLSDPFQKKAGPKFDDSELEAFKRKLLKAFPKATLKSPDKWNRVFAYVDKEMVGQYLSQNDRTDNKPGWLVHNPKEKFGDAYAMHNW